MIDRTFLDGIVDLVKAQTPTVELDGRTYSTRGLTPMKGPQVETLTFASLLGFRTYLGNPAVEPFDFPILDGAKLAFHVPSFDVVNLISEAKPPFLDRQILATAKACSCEFPFRQFMDQETFVIQLQAQFEESATRAQLLQMVGTATGSEIRTEEDNGVTQNVTAKSGSMLGRIDLPNPVCLAPYRTFRELDQPTSPFVLRARKSGEGMAFALFEADGGAWKHDALKTLREYLTALGTGLQILG
jgi:hypothetical protein